MSSIRLKPAAHLSSMGHTRWIIGGLLGIGSFVNYIDRVNLSIAATPLANALHLGPSQMGIVFSAFLWTYAVLQIPVGTVIDRMGVGWTMRFATILWVVATVMTACAGGLGMLIIARLALGVAEAPVVPSAWKATGYWFPRSERGMCTSMFDGASKLSIVLGIPAMAYAVTHYGWQAAFYVTAAVSMLYAILFWTLYGNPSDMRDRGRLSDAEHRYILEGGAQVEGDAKAGTFGDVLYLLRRRKTWGLSLGFASYTYSYYVLLSWMPGYLEKQLGLNVMSSGIYTSIPWVIAVVAEFVVGGWMVDKLIRCGADATRVRRIVLVASMILSMGVVGAATTSTLWVALAFLSLGAAGLAITAPTASSIVALIAPQGSVAALGGIVNCVANLIGISAPIITGLIYQHTGSFAAAFIISGLVAFAGILSYIFILGPIQQIPSQPKATPL